jgi:hypothetical protein
LQEYFRGHVKSKGFIPPLVGKIFGIPGQVLREKGVQEK